MTVLQAQRRARTRRALRYQRNITLYDARQLVGLHGPTVRRARKRYLNFVHLTAGAAK